MHEKANICFAVLYMCCSNDGELIYFIFPLLSAFSCTLSFWLNMGLSLGSNMAIGREFHESSLSICDPSDDVKNNLGDASTT